MISNCVGCGTVIAKYAPLDEVRWELCQACVERQHRAEMSSLSCGEPECVYLQVPYECLRRAAGDGSIDCPARRDRAALSRLTPPGPQSPSPFNHHLHDQI